MGGGKVTKLKEKLCCAGIADYGRRYNGMDSGNNDIAWHLVMDMLDYRLMTIDDYEAAYDLWIKCGNGLNDKDDSREGIEKYLKRNPSTSYVAVLDDKVVGVILCGHDGRRGIIQHACVSPDCRRMGIGKKLVDLAVDALKKEGINKVLLVAFKKNEGGNAFWEAQGFTVRDDLNYRNKALAEMIRIDPDYVK